MADLAQLRSANEARWMKAKITCGDFEPVARRLIAAKQRYQIVEKATGVPWYFIAVTHERESSQNWNASLAQGDPWNKVSTHVPAGRGPFKSWEAAAIDALVNCGPYAARNKDWTIGSTLTMLEQYNGLGYANRGVPSPYIWAGTNQYISGKYVSDGVYDPTAIDKQLGCAGLLLTMHALDNSVFGGVTPTSTPAPTHAPVIPAPPTPSTIAPTKPSFLAALFTTISELFKRKK